MTPVILVMIDGMRPDAMQATPTPTLDRIMKRGAWTLTASSVMPSITLPCHVSMFYSQPPERHGITSNTWTPMARPLPSIVDQAALFDRHCAFFHSWEQLRDLNQPGSLRYAYFRKVGYEEIWGEKPMIETAIDYQREASPDFVFLYFGTPDTIGHLHGWMSSEYLTQISRVDELLGQFIATLPDDYAILVQADHGGHERSHGTDTPEDMVIPWMVAGPGIRQNYHIRGEVNLIDTTPTLARLLDVQPHEDWEGRCIDEAFVD